MALDLTNRLKAPALSTIVLILCSAGLLACSIYRAATYSFTHDESLTFAIFTWEPAWGTTTNHHLLNTWAVECWSILFGNSELALRLHTLVAHGIYLAAGLAILKRLRHPVLQFSGFVLLNLNPFMLDFFFLARGYGMALAFEMAGLYFLVCAWEKRDGRGFKKALILSSVCGALAVLSNYIFLNFDLPLLFVIGGMLLYRRSGIRPDRTSLVAALALIAANGVFLALILLRLFRLRGHGEFWWGGRTGFVADTVYTFVEALLYGVDYPGPVASWITGILTGFFGAAAILAVGSFFVRKKDRLFCLFFFLLAGAVALPVLQHRIFHVLYPVERAGLYFIPLYMLTLLFAFEAVAPSGSRGWRTVLSLAAPVVAAGVMLLHFCISFSVTTCYLWTYDAHTRDAIEAIAGDRGTKDPVVLLNDWKLEPSLNFYRVTRHYTWLAPVTRRQQGKADYLYLTASEVKKIPAGSCTVLGVYPDSQTVLLRSNLSARFSTGKSLSSGAHEK